MQIRPETKLQDQTTTTKPSAMMDFHTLTLTEGTGNQEETLDSLIGQSPSQIPTQETRKIAIAIHGGAGFKRSDLTPEKKQLFKTKLSEALETGYKILKQGGTSTSAIAAAIIVLEDSPLFNAGKGAVYTNEETHELDASIMHGKNFAAGSVTGLKRIKNPINLARLVMDKSEHVMLAGNGAEKFAKKQGVELVDNSIFHTSHRFVELLKAKYQIETTTQTIKNEQTNSLISGMEYGCSTVGAVALDQFGDIAAGTSTGGMTNKKYGRIGDSAIIGSGTYANNKSCAVSVTGQGEYMICHTVAFNISARVIHKNETIEEAGEAVIQNELREAGGKGGAIIIDTQGNISLPFNTEGMYRASKSSTQESRIAIFSEDE